ncbi:MAG: transcriptional regulator [Rhizobium sp.]|nr:transcriptional regulator [Rhizobium sp.]
MEDMRALETEADYDRALAEVEAYFTNLPAAGSEAAERFNALTLNIQDYEMRHWRIDRGRSTPIS